MIIHSYRQDSLPMITLDDSFFQGVEIETCLATFSARLIEDLLARDWIEKIPNVEFSSNASVTSYVYLFKDCHIGICHFPVGASVAHGAMIETSALFHVKNWVVFGSCGGLVPVQPGHLLLMKGRVITIWNHRILLICRVLLSFKLFMKNISWLI